MAGLGGQGGGKGWVRAGGGETHVPAGQDEGAAVDRKATK